MCQVLHFRKVWCEELKQFMLSMILTHKYVITGLDKMTLKFQKIFSYYLYSKTNFLFEIYSKFAKE